MKTSCIYMISSICKPSRQYIGSTSNYNQRMAVHKNRLRTNIHHSKQLQAHYNKYGIEDLRFEIIEIVPNTNMLLIAEQSFLDLFKPCLNCSPTASSTLGIKLRPRSKEHSRKLSEARKRRIISEETRQLLRKKVYKYTLEGELLKTYNSLVEARIIEGKAITITSQKDPTSYGFVWINNSNKIPDFKNLKMRLVKAKNKLNKPVVQINKQGEFISEYASAREAYRKTGVHPSRICGVASNNRPFAGGFIWQYKNNYHVA